MSSSRRPWYSWYPKEFVADEKVKSLSDDAELLYRRALDCMWEASAVHMLNNSFAIHNQIARGWTSERFEAAWSELVRPGWEVLKTTEDGKFLYSERLRNEAQRIEMISKVKAENGRKSRAKHQPSISQANAEHQPNDPDPHYSSRPKSDDRKKESKKFDQESQQMRLAKYLFAHIKQNNPNAKEPDFDRWSVQFDSILRIDKRSVEDVRAVITWCQRDEFWKVNILSPDKLRKQFDQLFVKMNSTCKEIRKPIAVGVC